MNDFVPQFLKAVAIPRTEEPLYETDYYAWIQQQADALRDGRLNDLDVVNLLDEVEDLGKSERRSVESRQEVLHMHLLKWLIQPERRGASWEATIREQRRKLTGLLRENPSLKSMPSENLDEVHEIAVLKAVQETGMAPEAFPATSPFTVEQTLDPDFWPDK